MSSPSLPQNSTRPTQPKTSNPSLSSSNETSRSAGMNQKKGISHSLWDDPTPTTTVSNNRKTTKQTQADDPWNIIEDYDQEYEKPAYLNPNYQPPTEASVDRTQGPSSAQDSGYIPNSDALINASFSLIGESLSKLTSVAATAATYSTEVAKSTAEKLSEGNILNTEQLASALVDTSNKGWSLVSNVWQKALEYTGATETGPYPNNSSNGNYSYGTDTNGSNDYSRTNGETPKNTATRTSLQKSKDGWGDDDDGWGDDGWSSTSSNSSSAAKTSSTSTSNPKKLSGSTEIKTGPAKAPAGLSKSTGWDGADDWGDGWGNDDWGNDGDGVKKVD
eukprot:TRINITY_DN4830_c0_g4_i1.p1 TRINITY_DN4830_c0_g4~~TRINITY_DN4830_c0_g4_i1.p1  ORF type:complete len:333 (-),score=94.96 TRINITY_DN4830_c0_g4_i1:454-1452(-)